MVGRITVSIWTICGAGLLAVIVVPWLMPKQITPSESQVPLYQSCTGTGQVRRDCFEAIAKQLITERGLPTALATTESAFVGDEHIQGECHPLVHEIGHWTWEKYDDIGAAFAAAGRDGRACAAGFYHGVMESSVASLSVVELQKILPTVCDDVSSDRRSYTYYDCVHGLGHGLLAFTDDDVSTSLTYCQLLRDDWERTSCASGVFMQNIVNETAEDGHTPDFRTDDPLYPCTAVAPLWQPPCYQMQTTHLFTSERGNLDEIAALCATVADEKNKTYCYQSFGRDINGMYSPNLDTVTRACRTAGAGFTDCFIGAVRDMVYYTNDPSVGEAACRTVPDITTACLAGLANDIEAIQADLNHDLQKNRP